MEGTQTETKTESKREAGSGAAAGAAGTSASEDKKQESGAAGAGSGAAGTETSKTGGNADGNTSKKPDSKELAREMFNQRQEKKAEKKAVERVAELEKEAATLREQLAQTTRKESKADEAVDFLDDPKKWAEGIKKESAEEAAKLFEDRAKQAREEFNYRQDTEKSTDWLLTRSHVKEDESLAKEVIKCAGEKYAHVLAYEGARDPQNALRLAYLDVCASKGIVPDMDGFKGANFDGTKGNASSGTRHSGNAGSGGKRVYTRGEAEKEVFKHKPGTAAYNAALQELEEASKEGRIR